MHPKSRAEKSSATPSSPGTKPRTKSLVVHFKLPKSKTEETSVEHSRPKSEAGMESLMVRLKVKLNDVGLASNLKPKVMLKLNQLQTSDLNHSTNDNDTPRPELDNAGLFGRLPGELRNKISELAYRHSAKVLLPRKVRRSREPMILWGYDLRAFEDSMADVERLDKFRVPALAQACKLMRRECLEVYYSINKFLFVFSCSNYGKSEKDGLASLCAMGKIFGRRIQLLRPQALEIRFLEALSMSRDTWKLMAVFFAKLHANGLKVESDVRQRQLSFSVGWVGAAETGPAVKILMARLSAIGVVLSQKPCGCKNQPIKSASSKKRRLMMFECDKDVESTMNRMMR